ncbi:MAG: flap endonuclease-1 [Nitrososphaerota archaeon]|nr:flap endonuclease-1 [Aigarchaeota archaeon]MDW8076106.1 flap endonuclease-1 [Nitrososphaerota archaeon]
MGVKLGDIVPPEAIQTIALEVLRGRAIALDAFNMLYQFLATIRGPDGRPLMDSRGRITSHLSGLFFRTVNLLEKGIKPVYVFDGRPPELKRATVEKRMESRREAGGLYEKALLAGDMEAARKYAQRAATLEEYMLESSKRLLDAMGIPTVQAPSEGEAQAAYMAAKGDVYASASQDMDSLLFGSPRLVRNLSIVGKRKLPGKKAYVEIEPELISLDILLSSLGITRELLIDIGILVGTDYCEGVKGIGPKKALKLVKEYGSAEKVLEALNATLEVPPEVIRQIFLKPNVTDNYTLKWEEIDYRAVKSILCDEHDFSSDRVDKALAELKVALEKGKGETSLDAWLS